MGIMKTLTKHQMNKHIRNAKATIIKNVKKLGAIKAWEFRGYIFTIDENEDASFYKIERDYQLTELIENYPKIFFDKEYKEMEGCDFMENGEVLFQDKRKLKKYDIA